MNRNTWERNLEAEERCFQQRLEDFRGAVLDKLAGRTPAIPGFNLQVSSLPISAIPYDPVTQWRRIKIDVQYYVGRPLERTMGLLLDTWEEQNIDSVHYYVREIVREIERHYQQDLGNAREFGAASERLFASLRGTGSGMDTRPFSLATPDYDYFTRAMPERIDRAFREDCATPFPINYPASCVIQEQPINQKAKGLLLAFLTPDQQIEYEKDRAFICVGSKTGVEYKITPKSEINIEILSGPNKGRKGCMVSKDTVPVEDQMLAQKLVIENNEEIFLDVAVIW